MLQATFEHLRSKERMSGSASTRMGRCVGLGRRCLERLVVWGDEKVPCLWPDSRARKVWDRLMAVATIFFAWQVRCHARAARGRRGRRAGGTWPCRQETHAVAAPHLTPRPTPCAAASDAVRLPRRLRSYRRARGALAQPAHMLRRALSPRHPRQRAHRRARRRDGRRRCGRHLQARATP